LSRIDRRDVALLVTDNLYEVAQKVAARGAALLGISGDSAFCHDAFARARGFSFPLLSDVHRAVIRAYGVHDEERNVAYRSTFIVDRVGCCAGARRATATWFATATRSSACWAEMRLSGSGFGRKK
jgi:alkyl hydroperoxide reductase subunit AhpC